MSAHRPHLLATLAFLGVLAVSARAHAAAGSVSVLGVSGVGGPHFAEELERDLLDLYELVPGEVYRSAAERLGRRGASPEEVREVCVSLRVDALIAGSISGDGANRHLIIVVREGVSGIAIARTRYELAGRTLPLVRDQVLREIVRALERVRRIPKRGQPIAAEASSDPVEAPSLAEDGEPATRVVASAPARVRAVRGFSAGVGPALMSRSLAFDVATAPGYRGGAVAAIRADVTVFPLALSNELADAHPVLASFGLAGSYERALGLRSTTPSGSTPGSASRFNILFVGRAPLGRGGGLTVETGYQQLNWSSSSENDLGVPNVGYGLFDFGLSFEHTLGTRILALSIRAVALAVVQPGDIAADQQYGPTTGGGLEADLGLTIRPNGWLWLRAGVRYTPLFLRFAAAGARLAHSATDQFVDANLEVGFAL